MRTPPSYSPLWTVPLRWTWWLTETINVFPSHPKDCSERWEGMLFHHCLHLKNHPRKLKVLYFLSTTLFNIYPPPACAHKACFSAVPPCLIYPLSLVRRTQNCWQPQPPQHKQCPWLNLLKMKRGKDLWCCLVSPYGVGRGKHTLASLWNILSR